MSRNFYLMVAIKLFFSSIEDLQFWNYIVDIKTYKKIFSLLLSGEKVAFDKENGLFSAEISSNGSLLPYPKIGIYSGNGSSHSWLWLVDLLENYFLYDISFLNGKNILKDDLNHIDIFIVSGGDTFAIAEEIGEEGSNKIKSFLESGGTYIGICAGAYLMLKSSKTPLNFFNFTGGKIKNISSSIPEPLSMSYKFSIKYGCQYLYHPVRGPVEIKLLGIPPLYNSNTIISPVYGGGFFIPSEDLIALANFHAFTKDTLFLVKEELATKTVLGSCAALKKNYGKGTIFLFSPHFEHPQFPKGNNIIID